MTVQAILTILRRGGGGTFTSSSTSAPSASAAAVRVESSAPLVGHILSSLLRFTEEEMKAGPRGSR